MKRIIISAALYFVCSVTIAQKRIAVLGSSTAYGNGASTFDSSWQGRLRLSFKKNMADGVDTSIDNLAAPGHVTYHGLPTDFVTPANRTNWMTDPIRNVSYILNLVPKPNIVILNYPSNDVFITPNYDMKETMDNLRLMFQRLNAGGIVCFVTSSQPRNDANALQKTQLRSLLDSITNNFGTYAINFWDDLVTNDGLNNFRLDLTADGIHPTNTGHRLLFQKVQAKNIFSFTSGVLPLNLTEFTAQLHNNSVAIQWHTENEEPNSFFQIERSANGREFEKLTKLNATGNTQGSAYVWSDQHPLTGKSFYRLKIEEAASIRYSNTISLVNETKRFFISRFTNNGSLITAEINAKQNESAEISVVNMAGAILKKKQINLVKPGTNISIAIEDLPAGQYFFTIATPDGNKDIQSFSRLK